MPFPDHPRRKAKVRHESGQPGTGLSSAGAARILRGLAITFEEEYDCAQVERLMAEYTEMVSRGDDTASLLPLVKYHLQLCLDCREEYEALLRALEITI